jgi:zinc protease
MSKGRHLAAAVIVLLGLGPGLAAAPIVTTLDNGLKVCVSEDFSSDTVAAEVLLHISADCEPDGKAGLRSVLQHALRARCAKWIEADPGLVLVRDMEDTGGGLSINTDWEYVAVGYAGLSDTLSTGLAFLARGVFEPEIGEEAAQSAREVVLGAAQGPESEPAASTVSLFRLALFGRVSRAYPLGTAETLRALSVADLNAFHRRYYVPNLACVTVVGPVNARTVQDEVGKAFAALPQGDSQLPPPPAAPTASRVRAGGNPELAPPDDRQMDIASLVVGVPLPGLASRDEAIGHVIRALLGGNGGPKGRLDGNEALWATLGLPFPTKDAQNRGLIQSLPSVSSSLGYLAIHAYAAPRQVEALRAAIAAQFQDLRDTPPTADELSRAKHLVTGGYSALFNSPANRALILGRSVLLGVPNALAPDFARQVSAITAEDVQRVTTEYFGVHAVGIEFPDEGPVG